MSYLTDESDSQWEKLQDDYRSGAVDWPPSDTTPYDILREAIEGVIADVEWTQRNPWMALQMLKIVRSDLERALYLAAGGGK